jgi:hypothetical protein
MDLEDIVKKLIAITEQMMGGADTDCYCENCIRTRRVLSELLCLQEEIQKKKADAKYGFLFLP